SDLYRSAAISSKQVSPCHCRTAFIHVPIHPSGFEAPEAKLSIHSHYAGNGTAPGDDGQPLPGGGKERCPWFVSSELVVLGIQQFVGEIEGNLGVQVNIPDRRFRSMPAADAIHHVAG